MHFLLIFSYDSVVKTVQVKLGYASAARLDKYLGKLGAVFVTSMRPKALIGVLLLLRG